LRVALEQERNGIGGGRLLDAEGDHEVDRLRLAPDGLAEREPGLAERKVERRALVRPPPVVEEGVHSGPGGEESKPREEL
jgi:hypothetical protein